MPGKEPIPIGVNGLGQIGSSLLFLAAERDDIHVVAANDRGVHSVDDLAAELKWDGVHGKRSEDIHSSGRNLTINGRSTAVLQEADPEKIPWTELGAEIVIEATGRFRSGDAAARHLAGGARKVIISSPSTDADVKTVVAGINHHDYDPLRDQVISGGSCGLRGLTWLIKGMQLAGYTIEENTAVVNCTLPNLNIQEVQYRPGRRDPALAQPAALNIVPHEYNIGNLLQAVMPELGAVSDDSNIVPVPQGQSVVLHGTLTEATSLEKLNEALQHVIDSEEVLKGRLAYATIKGMVSSMVWGRTEASVLDITQTTLRDGGRFKLKGWLDTRKGYGSGLLDLVQHIDAVGRL